MQGARNKEQETRNKEPGTWNWNKEQVNQKPGTETRYQKQGALNQKQETRSQEPGNRKHIKYEIIEKFDGKLSVYSCLKK